MKTKKGDLTYTDGVMKIIVKRKYAYYYNLKTGSLIFKAEIDDYLFTQIKNAGFKRQEPQQKCNHDRLYKSVVGKWFHCRDCGEYWSDQTFQVLAFVKANTELRFKE